MTQWSVERKEAPKSFEKQLHEDQWDSSLELIQEANCELRAKLRIAANKLKIGTDDIIRR
jgi:hypothetical protein